MGVETNHWVAGRKGLCCVFVGVQSSPESRVVAALTDLHELQVHAWAAGTWIPLISTGLTISTVTSFPPRWLLWGESLPQWGNMCDRSRGRSIYLHLCRWLRWRHLQPDRDGYVAEETFIFFNHSCCLLTSSLLPLSQGPAAQTPARTMDCVRWWHRPDEGMFSTSTSASASQALRGCTARPVSYLQKSCWSVFMELSTLKKKWQITRSKSNITCKYCSGKKQFCHINRFIALTNNDCFPCRCFICSAPFRFGSVIDSFFF